MKIHMFNIGAVSALMLAVSACNHADSAKNLPEGNYEDSKVTTRSDGTRVETTTTTDVDKDSDGRKSATVKTKTTEDPKGLFNKKTVYESKEVSR